MKNENMESITIIMFKEEEFKEQIKKAIEQGDANAMKELGIRRLNGEGVSQNTCSGLDILENACKMGSTDSIDLLGSFADKPYMVEYPLKRYILLLQEIADKGNQYAMKKLREYNAE